MYINFINDRKSLGFMCLRDIEAVILGTGVICIAIFVNSSLFLIVDRSYSDRPFSNISNQELNILEDSHNSGITR